MLPDDVDEEGGVADSHNPDESANPKAEESSREKENSQNRRVAFRFVSPGGLLLVPILRLVMDPLAKLLREHLYLASARWEAQQRAKASMAVLGGNCEILGARKYRVCVCASGAMEKQVI